MLAGAVAACDSEGRRLAVHHVAFPGADAHAGRTETSVMLHLAPELARLDRAEPGTVDPVAELMPRLTAEGVAAVSPSGVLGDPTAASASEGGRLLDRAIGEARAAASLFVTGGAL